MNNIAKRVFCAGLSAAMGISFVEVPGVFAAEVRYNGGTRIETAAKIAQNGWPSKADYAVIAAADDDCLIDSLIVAPLAKAYNAPILVNYKGDKLDAEVFEMIKQWGVKKVFIASSEKALKKGIEDELTGAGISIERLGKDSKRETSLNIANELKMKLGNMDGAFVVSEDSSHLVDALSVASIAGIKGMPILLSPQAALPTEIKTFLSKNDIKKCYVIGGQTVLSDSILKDANATRLSGADRYKTNLEVLGQFKSDLKFDTAFFSSGNDGHLVDALAGSVLAAEKSSPIILVGDDLAEGTKQFVKSNLNTKSLVEVFGGEGAVSTKVEANIDAVIYGEESGLLSVRSAEAVNSSLIKVTLNHRVSSVTASQFKITDSSGNIIESSAAEAAPWDGNGRTVLVALKNPVASGNSYDINSVQFDGTSDAAQKPVLTGIETTDYDKIKLTFSEPVRLNSININISGSDDSKLQAINKTYVAGSPNKVEITTSDQKDSMLYSIEVTGAKDFLDRVIDDVSGRSFTGIGKDTSTKLSVVSAEAITSKSVLVTFNTRVDDVKAVKAFYYKLDEQYTSDTSIDIQSARMTNDSDTEVEESSQKKCVVLTLVNPMKDSTVYKLSASGLSTSSGVDVDSSANNATFIGVGPFSSKMDMADDGNKVIPVNSKKVNISFKRHMNMDLFTKDNFNIIKMDNNQALKVKSLNVIDDRNVQLEVESMSKAMYKLTLKNLLDVDNNAFEDNKNSKVFEGKDKSESITGIESAVLQSDNSTLLLTFDASVGSNAADVSLYSIDNGVGYPTKAEVVSGSPNVVKLTIPTVTSGKVYNITVKGLQNPDGNVIDANGLYSSFTSGVSTALPVVKAVTAVDCHTLQITFDRSVKDSSIDGPDKIWTSSKNLLNTAAIIVKGVYNRQIDSNSNLYVYQNPKNQNMLIIKCGNTEFLKVNADTNGKFELQTSKIDASSKISFTYNDGDMQSIVISDVKALDKATVRVTFDQPVKIEKNAEFAWVANSQNVADYIKVSGNSSSGAFKLTNPTPLDTAYTTYDFIISGGDLSASYNWFVVNPAITNGFNGVHDYTADGIKGFVTLADEDSVNTGIQQVRKFSGSTTAPGSVSSVSVTMNDCKTIAVQYPEVMNSKDTTSVNSTLNKANYKLVDKNGSEIGSGFLSTHIVNTSYDYSSNKVILSLNAALPQSNNGYYIQFANTMQNTLGTKYVKSADNISNLSASFTPSTAAAQKLSITTVGYQSNSKTLTIKLSQKAVSLVKYTASILAADFDIQVTDGDGKTYDLQSSDIQSVTTNISDSNSDDTINVIFKDTINDGKTLKSGAVGKVKFIPNNTLKSVTGETVDSNSYTVFTQ